MATFSIRLDAEVASALDRIALRTGKSKSEIMREALAEYTKKADKKDQSERPYDKVKHLIGSCDSGGMQLSTNGGEKFAQMLLEERDARRRADRRGTPRRPNR
jgi:predicted DNA-binding protein